MKNQAKKHELNKDQMNAGLRAVFNILGNWGFQNEEMITLLGQPSRQTFYNWKKGKVANLPHDTTTRLSYVLGIYKALQILFPNPERADNWVSKPNKAFGGESAKERMLAGEIMDLAKVRQHLDAARGAW
ncbi:MAG: MbcA/ParS/Xre antitoxin family protein [Thermodesulfobacteriota bacterium]